jgi:hypothetical protein
MRSPALGFLLLVFAATAVRADVNLVEKREACQAEARQRIKPKGRVSADLSKALLAKRQSHVRACMEGKGPKKAPARRS